MSLNGWEEKKLRDVLAVVRNGVNCKQNKDGKGDMISRIESIAEEVFNVERVGYSELDDKAKVKYQLQRGDILFSHINSVIHVGKTAFFDCDEDVYHGVNLLLFRPNEEVTAPYLQLFLAYIFHRGYWRQICKQSVNQASVNQQDVKKVPIAFPKCRAEQERIVSILDEAFSAIAKAKENAEKNLLSARELFESYLNRVFTQQGTGWKEKPLEDFAEDIATGPFGSLLHKSDYITGGTPIVNPVNIEGENIVPNESKTISDKKKQELEGYILNENDVVIGRRGEMGRCAVVTPCQSWLALRNRLLHYSPVGGHEPAFPLSHAPITQVPRTNGR